MRYAAKVDSNHAVMPDGWHAHAWNAAGGYGSQGNGRGRANSAREVVWFSPHCLNPVETLPLFATNGAAHLTAQQEAS